MVHAAVYSNHVRKLYLTYHKRKKALASKNVCLTYDLSDQKILLLRRRNQLKDKLPTLT